MANKLTDQEQLFIDTLIESKGDPVQAATVAGYAPTYGYALVRRLKDEIIDSAKAVLALHGTRAAFTFTDALNSDLPVHRDRLEAAKQILDRIGIIKEEKVSVETNLPGIFILPSKDPE